MSTRKIDWLNHGLEFIIVVVGILLAFQLNTWSEQRKQRSTIQEHLMSIEEETQFNLGSMDKSIQQIKRELANIDTMLVMIKSGADVQVMNRQIYAMLAIGRAYFKKNAYKTLSTSGDIRFIKDFQLKEDIVKLYEYYSWTEAVDRINLEYYMAHYYPYVMDNFDMLEGRPQIREKYTSNKFKNILAGYRYQVLARKTKYDECYEKIAEFMKRRRWKIVKEE